jgi:hypothetical protein
VKKKSDKRKQLEAAFIKTATVCCEEKLDSGGFNLEDCNITEPVVDSDDNVTFVVHVTITSLDIEQAQRAGK